MKQLYKTVYFTDYPADMSQKKNLTLAFGEKDGTLYETIKDLSSQEVREWLGFSTYTELKQAAQEDALPLNTYCLRLLRQREISLRDPSQQYTLPYLPAEVGPTFDPLQVTFKGGQQEPLHAWYPFLEGYSPGFVERIIEQFAPQAQRILDPFSGTGTTPLTVARLGREAYYCELSPLMQFLTAVKGLAQALSPMERHTLSNALRELAERWANLLSTAPPDTELEVAYRQTFRQSCFFPDTTFHQVLQARSALDRLACTQPLEAKFLTVAVLACLIPASYLIRRGDLRFKTEKERQQRETDFQREVQNQLVRIADDLERLAVTAPLPKLVCENARFLDKVPPLAIEAVITSPPYLNGTNYFRNAKLELWFLRCLHKAQDLSAFRQSAITAGINDVTVGKMGVEMHDKVRQVVETLEAVAYDIRIPRMVRGYFSDMQRVFRGLKPHLTENASVVIDIGDSAYSDVHVPTDTLLIDLLEAEGLRLERQVTLRRRMSRSGFPLRQTLLAFRVAPHTPPTRLQETRGTIQARWEPAWTQFKAELPHQQGEFSKRNWGHPLHSLCSYQGKMKPSLAAHLVKTFVPSGGSLLDPFAGVGTIPFEAALLGVHAWGFEISPAAFHIATAKCGQLEPAMCQETLTALETFLQQESVTEAERQAAQAIRFNGPLPDYFAPDTWQEVLLARRYFRLQPPQNPSESLVFAALLHILHGNRPYALSRRSHPITPFAPTGPAEYRPLLPRLREKVLRSLVCSPNGIFDFEGNSEELSPHGEQGVPSPFLPGQICFQDATSWWPQEVSQLDAIITSPPFFDSTRFYLANWMRLWFCGWEAADFRTQPLAFVEERQKQGFQVYEPIFRQARERLKAGGVFVLHLGKSAKCDMATELVQVASRWFRIADRFTESVQHCESHGIRDKGTVTSHQFLVLC